MKRLTAILVAGLFVLAPLSASAMEMMSDSNMKDVTGQAGVSIAVDDVVLYQESLADVTYRDTDGMTIFNTAYDGTNDISETQGNLGDAGITIDYTNQMSKVTIIDAIEDANTYGTAAINTAMDGNDQYVDNTVGILSQSQIGADLYGGLLDPLTGNVTGEYTSGLSALTIDVGTCSVLTDGIAHNLADQSAALGGSEVAGVIIGLPTVEITTYANNNTRNIRVTSNDGSGAVNEGKSFIQIEEAGYSKMAILGGTVEIAPH